MRLTTTGAQITTHHLTTKISREQAAHLVARLCPGDFNIKNNYLLLPCHKTPAL